MENVAINRSYLESLSFSDLLKIADEFGIDFPEDLSRGFLIGEILEVQSEVAESSGEPEMIISDEDMTASDKALTPRSFNSTEVQILLRSPAWAFVFWNISDSDRISLEKADISQMMLRVSSFDDKDQLRSDEYFDIQISKDDNGQYVLLPSGRTYFRVDLLFNLDGIIDILSSSKVMEMPKGADFLSDMRPGRNDEVSEILKLSGFNELLLEHYKNHRESFS